MDIRSLSEVQDSLEFRRNELVTIELPDGTKLAGNYDSPHKGKHIVAVGNRMYSVDDDHIWKKPKEKRLIPDELKEKITNRLKEIEGLKNLASGRGLKSLESEERRLNEQLSKYRMQ